jgi:hypothetical protein
MKIFSRKINSLLVFGIILIFIILVTHFGNSAVIKIRKFCTNTTTQKTMDINNYKFHIPIFIDSDDDFEKPTILSGIRGGKGTKEDPYIISGWNINGGLFLFPTVFSRVGMWGIYIKNTEKHIVIENNYIHHFRMEGPRRWAFPDGICIINAKNVTIRNNNISSNFIGIECRHVNNLIIENNTILGNNYAGITCREHAKPMIVYNTIQNNGHGIECREYSNAEIVDNNILSNRVGITCYDHSNSYIAYNNILSNEWLGVGAEYYSTPIILNNNISSISHYVIKFWTDLDKSKHRDILIHYNNFRGSYASIYNYDDLSINATYNWWGSSKGPNSEGAVKIVGNVTYLPFLTEPNPDAGPR